MNQYQPDSSASDHAESTQEIQREAFSVTAEDHAAFLLFVFLNLSAFVPIEITSVLMFLCICWLVWMRGMWIPRVVIYIMAPILLFIAIGLSGSAHCKPYNVVKDVWYVGKSLQALVLGFLLMDQIKDLRKALKVILISSLIAATFHIVHFIFNPEILQESVRDLRSDAGRGFMVCGFAIALLVTARKFRIGLFDSNKWMKPAVLLFCFFSLTLSLSRTQWASLLIMMFVTYDVINLKRIKSLLIIISFLAAFLLASTLVPQSASMGPGKTFLGKVVYSFKEIVIKNYKSRKDINLNFRGFESYRALVAYLKGNKLQYLTGQGFGTLVDLGLNIKLGETEMRYLPTLHNGYMYVLVKTGIIGIMIYILFFLKFIRYGLKLGRLREAEVRFAGKMIVALSLVLLTTTLVISGFLNKTTMISIIMALGVFLAYANTAQVKYRI